jgi:hypothetical protein
MSAYKPIYWLLSNNAAVTTLVADRISPVTVPQRESDDQVMYPCLVIAVVSEKTLTMVGLETTQIATSRVQVTVLAEDYGTKEQLMAAVISACHSGYAMIDGVQVNGIITLQQGPDFRDEAVKLFMQSQDFQVQYIQIN